MQIHLQVIFTIGCNLMRMYEYLNKISSSSLFTSCRKYKRPRLIQILVYNTEYTYDNMHIYESMLPKLCLHIHATKILDTSTTFQI